MLVSDFLASLVCDTQHAPRILRLAGHRCVCAGCAAELMAAGGGGSSRQQRGRGQPKAPKEQLKCIICRAESIGLYAVFDT